MFTADRRREVRAELIDRARRVDRSPPRRVDRSPPRRSPGPRPATPRTTGPTSTCSWVWRTASRSTRPCAPGARSSIESSPPSTTHFDLRAGAAVYRAFLLPDCLEVDHGFTPAHAFRSLAPGSFRLVFGDAAGPPPSASRADVAHLAGLAWHHVLHGRVSIERGAVWQAEYWISAVRDHTVTLACARLGLPAAHAKGADDLPAEITDGLGDALVRALDRAELIRALRAVTAALLRELDASDAALAGALREPLLEMAGAS